MDLKLIRKEKSEKGIFSDLCDMDGKKLFDCASHAYQLPDGSWEPKIANGTYTVKRYFSPKHSYELFWVQNIPDFMGKPVSMCEFHCGNYPQKDSIGCELVGHDKVNDMVVDSRSAFSAFMLLQEGIEEFTLVVE